jgi:hypothetical protein
MGARIMTVPLSRTREMPSFGNGPALRRSPRLIRPERGGDADGARGEVSNRYRGASDHDPVFRIALGD